MNNIPNNNLHDNITFFFAEKEQFPATEGDYIQQILEELNQEEDEFVEDKFVEDKFVEDKFVEEQVINKKIGSNKLMYFMDKEFYGDDELYYNQEYTIKDLLKICEYYGIEKNIKSSKCKKQDIVSTIVYFESLPENYNIVIKRNRMWAYMMELFNDVKMKKYVIWEVK